MKSSVSPVNPPFVPVSLHLTFETQQELDCFASLLNTVRVVEALEKVGDFDPQDFVNVVEQLNNKGADASRYPGEITHEISRK